MDRRTFLALGGASLSSLLLGGCDWDGPRAAGGLLRWAERRTEGAERALFRPGSRDRPPAGRLAGRALPVYFVSPRLPVWDEAARGRWTLEVSGLVRRPLRLSLPELQRLRPVEHRVDHFCVEGWNAIVRWRGVRVSELARLAGVLPDAGFVDFQSFDQGYHESWDLESAMHPQTLVAYGHDGRQLGPEHGAPARLHSPIKLGYKSVKYLTRIVFLPESNGGYWSDRGYQWYAGT
jgi:DMSO/TMAO reductase YedYZ molybdopterin-dependent catalytic subunit